MSRINPVGSNTAPQRGSSTDLSDVDMSQFLDLMIAELQNQDPLNPMDNSEFIQQIGLIREIGATNQLTQTLSAVLAGQNLTTASSLIGRSVQALTDDGKNVEGVVDRVSVTVDPNDKDKRTLRVHIGADSVDLKNVREIVAN